MSSNYFDLIIGAAGLTASVFGIGYAIGQRKKLKDVCEKIDKSIDEVASNVNVDISESVVKTAVSRAIDRETALVARQAADRAVESIRSDISEQVHTAVQETYTDIRKAVVDETAKKVSKIDIQKLKNEVVEKAKKDAADKLDGCLDGILDDFNSNLENVSKIYKSIAQVFPNGSTEKGLKISLG